jgi:membrane-associated phospholipid phosphatase
MLPRMRRALRRGFSASVAGIIAAAALSAPDAAAAEPAMPNPFEALGSDTASAFTGTNLLYYGAALASVAVLSPSGGDHAVRVAVQEHVKAPVWGDAAYYGGYLIPVILTPAVYVTGLVARERSVAGAGAAALLALGLTEVTTVVLKVGTGRPFPLHGEAPDAPDRLRHPGYAKEFTPFGFAGRYAWPSGHTSAAFALASAFTSYAHTPWVTLTAYPIAVGIGAGMIVGDHHWASDVLSGAAIGQAIGWTVGANFRARARAAEQSDGAAFERREDGAQALVASWTVVPLLGEANGAAIVGALW